MKNKNFLDEKVICKEYCENNIGIETMALKYHVGKIRIKNILIKNDIELKKRGGQSSKEVFVVSDWRTEKYPQVNGKHYVAIDKKNGYRTNDYMNEGGFLTSHINATYAIEIPSLYERRMYYKRTGNYWWEQWFDIVLEDNVEVKKCPYCEWETKDLENKSGMFLTHIKKEHGLTIMEHLKLHPEDTIYFSKYTKEKKREEKLKQEGNFVICPICGERYEKLTQAHIEKLHGLKWAEFKHLYPDAVIMSETALKQTLEVAKKANLVVSKKRFRSKYEVAIESFIKEHGLLCDTNRQILEGKEIDLLMPEQKIGIEFDGLKFHTEFFGKKPHDYHLDKTKTCNAHGYKLIHIFEDEYVNHEKIVYSKLGHILGFDKDKPKVNARECVVKKIYKSDAKRFLEEWHIQGFSSSTFYYGAFYCDELVAVMSFKHGNIKSKDWELTRFATSDKYIYRGIGGKLFSKFVKDVDPDRVVSFADRRWTLQEKNNLYTKLGFSLDKKTPPDYRYYNEKVDRYQRVHKMFFMKSKLIKKYGFPDNMTEWEMARELGYDRIWDCGLFKYVWKKKDNDTTTNK